VKKNKLHIALSVFLLALMLAGRVGIHIFHHHESRISSELATFKQVHPSTAFLTDAENDADCAICKLDAFQEIALNAFAGFTFLLIFGKPFYRFFLSDLTFFSFFTKSRGPPSFAAIA
jgi:hypothetical protein